MRFLHEYEKTPSGKKYDNGYWEICEDGYLYNSVGGRHKYYPSEDDEIIEADDWNKIIKMTVRDDSQETGFISPDGEFFGCSYQSHFKMEEYFFEKTEHELEESGFIKIFKTSFCYKNKSYQYIAKSCKSLITDNQKNTLERKGFEEVTRTMWGK